MATLDNLMKFTKEALEDFGKSVVEKSKKRFVRKYKDQFKATTKGKLYKAIDYELEVERRDILIKYPFMKDIEYAKYVDLGVKGKTSSFGVSRNSPFKFGSGTGKKGGLRDGILKWVKAKKLQFQDKKTKRFLSYKSTSYLISRKVYNKGIPAKKFFTRSFDEAYQKLPKELIEAFALDIKNEFKKYTTE